VSSTFNKTTGTLYYDKRSTDTMSTAVVNAPTAEASSTSRQLHHQPGQSPRLRGHHLRLHALVADERRRLGRRDDGAGNDLLDKYVADGDIHKASTPTPT